MSVLSACHLVFVKVTQCSVTPPESLLFLTLLSYGGLVFNISATVYMFLFTDRPSSMAIDSLLSRYGSGASAELAWTWTLRHCVYIRNLCYTVLTWLNVGSFCIFAGLWCTIIQIFMYVLLRESTAVQVGITCLVAFATMPPLWLWRWNRTGTAVPTRKRDILGRARDLFQHATKR